MRFLIVIIVMIVEPSKANIICQIVTLKFVHYVKKQKLSCECDLILMDAD
ncbi:MAG: hypothetical protein ACLUUG_09460 [Lachnospiraceae bacterium]